MSRRPALSALIIAVLLSRAAVAGPFEVLGLGPEGVAEVGARAARATDGSAAFFGPGGLAFGRGGHASLAPTLGISALHVQGDTLPLADPFGVTGTFDTTIPLTGALRDRVRFGFAGHAPPTGALHVLTRAGDEPFFPYYDNRTQRVVVLPALAVRLTRWLGVGAGLNVLAGVLGPAEVRAGASGAAEARIDEEVSTVVRANLGVAIEPARRVRLSGTFRQGFDVPSALASRADIAGVPLQVDVDVGQALFDPDVVVLGASFPLGPATAELDVCWSGWSAYAGPFVRVRAELPGVDIGSVLPTGLFRDVVDARAAAELPVVVGEGRVVTLRAGAGLEPSILSGVGQGRTNLVDGDKVVLGLGATLRLARVLPRALTLGAGVSVQALSSTEQRKRPCAARPCAAWTLPVGDVADNPGAPTLRAGGGLWSTSLGLGVDL